MIAMLLLMKKHLSGLVLLCLLFLCLLSGCNKDAPEYLMRLYVTTEDMALGRLNRAVVMPMSEKQLFVESQPIILEGDVVGVDLARTEIGLGLMLYMSPMASKEIYRHSVSKRGQYFVLFLNSQPIGLRPIESTMQGDSLFVYLEMPEQELNEIFPKLQESVTRAQEIKNDRW